MVNMNGQCLSLSMAGDLIAELEKRGHSKSVLRWRVSQGQLRSLQNQLMAIADLNTLRYEGEHGYQDHGMFMGVPYILDRTLRDDTLLIERIGPVEIMQTVSSLSVPIGVMNV